MKRMRQLLHDDSGIGLVMALSVSLIVFSLGAIWVSTSTHELDQVTHNLHRTEAFNAAEAGARRAMAELQNNNGADDWFVFDGTPLLASDGVRAEAAANGILWLGHDPTPGGEACPAVGLDSGAEQVGEYLVRVERLDLPSEGLEYKIESWGWGPDRDSRQAVLRKVEMEVVLRPLDTFAKALFAAKSMIGTNRKEIYGDVYAGESLIISNFTRIYPNDIGETGLGQLEVFGDMTISGGSNVELGGLLRVQGAVIDNAVGTSYAGADLVNTDPGVPGTFSTVNDFRNANTSDTVRYQGSLAAGWNLSPAASVIHTTSLDNVPRLPLPKYEFNPADYPTLPTTDWGTNVAGFQADFAANKTTLTGVHVVDLSGGSITVDFKNTRFDSDYMLIMQDGDVTIKGFTTGVTGSATPPVTVGIVLDDTRVPGLFAAVDDILPANRYTLQMQNGVSSIPGVVHHLIFTEGYLDVQNQVTIYGTVYGNDDVSSNRLEVHFRQPSEDIISGFNFVVPDSTRFVAQPVVWRELRPGEGTALHSSCSV